MEHLGVTDQAFHVRLGKEVGRGRDQQHFRTLDVDGQLDIDAGVGLDVFFQARQSVQ